MLFKNIKTLTIFVNILGVLSLLVTKLVNKRCINIIVRVV